MTSAGLAGEIAAAVDVRGAASSLTGTAEINIMNQDDYLPILIIITIILIIKHKT